jgi:hypothetical protein
MFHKSGALKGKPRGYAFVQFSSKDVSRPCTSTGQAGQADCASSLSLRPFFKDALKAMVKLHDRLLRGRKLVVTYASSVRCPHITFFVWTKLKRRLLLPTCHSLLKVVVLNRPRRPPYPCSRVRRSLTGELLVQ